MPAFRQENTNAANGRPTTRNVLGFQEGMSNPDVRDAGTMAQLVWVGAQRRTALGAGGSYQVIRLVRFATQLWDREPVSTQEAVFGRRRSDGVPLGRDTEPATSPIPTIRPAASWPSTRTSAAPTHVPRRRPAAGSCGAATPTGPAPTKDWSSSASSETSARASKQYSCRLTGEALAKYVLPFGGGYFFVLPGTAPDEYLGKHMLAA
jgi:deferrochelatase/peroxidase EfeB